MTQTLAIMSGAYHRLRTQKIFWIVLMLSVLMVGSFAMVGINQRGVTVLGFQIESPRFNSQVIRPELFYKGIVFGDFGIQLWLSFLAIILALVSTAGIFPDLLADGAIDLVLSRPISRLRVFLTVYASGLMFVALQVTVFCLAAFLVIGLRGGLWEPGVFVAVPLVVCLFSYLFCVCALIGLVTRSTVASLLLTLLFWLCLFGLHSTDLTILRLTCECNKRAADLEMRIEALQATSRQAAADDYRNQRLAQLRRERQDALDQARKLASAYRVVYPVKTVLPKTYETVLLLERTLIRAADLPGASLAPRHRTPMENAMLQLRRRPVWWVLGTSLAFEMVILAVGAVVFNRRDF